MQATVSPLRFLTKKTSTRIPVLEKHKEAFGRHVGEVTADSGYCCESPIQYSIVSRKAKIQ